MTETETISFGESCERVFELFDRFAEDETMFSYMMYKTAKVVKDHPLIKDPENEIVFKIELVDRFRTGFSTFHGGAVITLIDGFTSMAIMAKEDPPFGVSVSTKIICEFLRGMNIGQTAYFLCRIDKFGNRLAFCTCLIYNEKMELCYKGGQAKMRMNYDKLLNGNKAKL